MLVSLGTVNGYQLHYLTIGDGWNEALPAANWLLLVVADDYDPELFRVVTEQCGQKQPGSICCAGRCARQLEDWFDAEIVMQALDGAETDQLPVTTADLVLDEALWYAVTLAPNTSLSPVQRIVCLDLAGTYRDRIVALLPRLRAGWFPPDTDD